MSTTHTQQITPQLRQWIVEQAQAGHGAEAVLKSMLASGWTEDVAIEAMESTLRVHLEQKAQEQSLPAAVPVPDPQAGRVAALPGCGDRRVCVLQAMHNPRVVVFGGLLSDEECEALIELAKPRLARSLTVATKTGGEEVNADRTSNGMFFQRGENELVKRIEARIARLVNWPEENGEGLQVLHYRPGHRIQAPLRLLRSRRARYADDPQARRPARRHADHVPGRAGKRRRHQLSRRAAGSRAQARQRRLLQLRAAHPSTRSLHGGAPVIAGEKWIATKWLRERRFE